MLRALGIGIGIALVVFALTGGHVLFRSGAAATRGALTGLTARY